MQDDFNRKQWISENILQVLLFIANSEFTKLLEYDYLQPDGDELSQLGINCNGEGRGDWINEYTL